MVSLRLDIPQLVLLYAGGRKNYCFAAQGCRCWYCDRPMSLAKEARNRPDQATWEHISPLSRRQRKKVKPHLRAAWKGEFFNRILVCAECNRRRGDRPLTTFIGELRESGFTRGIVARIRHLINDHRPAPWQASEFEWYMIQALAHPRRPADCLKRLPAGLETTVLPDPAEPLPVADMFHEPAPAATPAEKIPQAFEGKSGEQAAAQSPPAPKRRAPPLVTRFFRTLWRFTQGVRQLPHRKEGACH